MVQLRERSRTSHATRHEAGETCPFCQPDPSRWAVLLSALRYVVTGARPHGVAPSPLQEKTVMALAQTPPDHVDLRLQQERTTVEWLEREVDMLRHRHHG